MREWINLVETLNQQGIPAMKAFVLKKWKDRAQERRESEPHDLTGACKFAAMFAQAILGGNIMANDFHTWVEVNGQVIDLAEDAADAKALKAGIIPPEMVDYAKAFHLNLPEHVYDADEDFMDLPDFKEGLEANRPRVEQWVREWQGNLVESSSAAYYDDQWPEGHPAAGPASRFEWSDVASYPISKIQDRTREEWIAFMQEEIDMWAEDGDPDRYEDELRNDIREPVVLVEIDGRAYVWDGNHRIAACVMTGRDTVPAQVGRPKPTEVITERAVPKTEYGYWVTDKGEIIPVDFERHDHVARSLGSNYGLVMQDGWIRVVVENNTLSINYVAGTIKARAISALKPIAGIQEFANFRVTVQGRLSINKHFATFSEATRLISRTSQAAISQYTNDDWQEMSNIGVDRN